MISAFRMGPDRQGEIRPTISLIENSKLLVNFRRAGTLQFFTCDWVTLNFTPSISLSPRQLAAGPIRNAKIMESLLSVADSV